MIPPKGAFIVTIEFVPKKDCLTQGITDVGLEPTSGLPLYTVKVARDRREERMQDALAHELGHVVANIFRTVAAVHDPRSGESRENIQTDNLSIAERCALFDSEREAWDFAIKIRPSVNLREMRESLESYI